ncbi:dienelactone hydrolase family protein [Parvibaculaceae bacterium PLY_AMNH_Bact1]|nr:dienelactone hydrolase family protein [Parvibaculaceae bacterium PLY_AMNH_Bact1]
MKEPLRREALSGDPKWLVVFLHGLGSNGADLMTFAEYWAKSMPDVAFSAPSAPTPCPDAPPTSDHPGGFQWIPKLPSGHPLLFPEVENAADDLQPILDQELAAVGLTPDRLALVGFSQGTLMALHAGLRRAVAPAALLGYAGGLVGRDRLANEITCKPPVMLINGDADPMVPAAAQAPALEALQAAGVVAAGQIMPGLDHSVNADALVLGARFLLSAFEYREKNPV